MRRRSAGARTGNARAARGQRLDSTWAALGSDWALGARCWLGAFSFHGFFRAARYVSLMQQAWSHN